VILGPIRETPERSYGEYRGVPSMRPDGSNSYYW
jgi:hypothetical protein